MYGEAVENHIPKTFVDLSGWFWIHWVETLFIRNKGKLETDYSYTCGCVSVCVCV